MVDLSSVAHHEHDARFVYGKMRRLPNRWKGEIGRQYSRRFNGSRREANIYLLDISDKAGLDSYRLAASDSELVEESKLAAKAVADAIDATYSTKGRELGFVEKSRGRFAFNPIDESPYKWCVKYADEKGIEPPVPQKDITESGCVERMKDQLWWRRAYRKNHGRRVEGAARKLGFVHKGAGIYSSDETLHRRKGQKSRNRKMLEEMLAINELGDQFTLAELSDLSVSNPAIRRGELMVRINGFEKIADDVGHKSLFVTLTCPSRFHSHTIRNKRSVENHKYDGSTPRDAQAYLQKLWTRIRAKLARHGITLYGFRIAEPNHDGCVHWHLLIFAPGWSLRRIRRTFREHALRDLPNERGAQKHRVTFVEIDPSKGTAAGYIAKYVAKNIDGHAIENDLFGNDVIDTIERVDAWRSCWGIRQFQQLGGPPVTVWRELRRIEGEESGILETARDAADRGDWATFVRAMGGPTCPRQSHPVKLAKAVDLIDFDEKTGEVIKASPALNKYGEPAAAQIIGVACDGQITATRWHVWELVHGKTNEGGSLLPEVEAAGFSGSSKKMVECKSSAKGVEGWQVGLGAHGNASITGLVEFGLSGANAPPWSSVNNCTRHQSQEIKKDDEYSKTSNESFGIGVGADTHVCESGGRWPVNRSGDSGNGRGRGKGS
ncbi:MAG: replication endonuclease [Candidatus Thiodiazotropha sp. (ex Troendleina suluensis)]|nr:replication endonuclease [Candidatus Thiodiazotropha sp. (ex Troendleina suluensis)]